MKPIKPFEPVTSATVPSSPHGISQVKWDGVRVLAYFDKQHLKLFNRSLNERTATYPELQELPSLAQSVSFILDGEIVSLNEKGEPSFHDVMRRDRLKKANQIAKGVEMNPIFYMVFDVILWDGKWVNDRPLIERLEILEEGLNQNKSIRIVHSHENGEQLFSVIKEKGMEGIVWKDLNSSYVINGKSDSWKKVKNYQDIFATVCGVTFRGNIINTFLLGLYDSNNQLRYIGSAGTGKLKNDEISRLSEMVTLVKQSTSPFLEFDPNRKDIVWLSPEIIVKVTYLEWTSDQRLRQPVVQTITDGDPKTCSFQQT
ncbi:RNA ligase family protein [Guptibacillus algicola]|uniref:ATP-dependent DNA ligase n=1 Tax=Guptibacillus algicola TaxID=225844 RepID=UPI001CD55194|nr:RNA ligase family protein [Alkalihalobacillus algicola]MCA0987766.1 DNA ligase [Alkalihalobacillus algicola]